MRCEKFSLSETNKDIHLECMLYTPCETLPSLKVRPAVVVCPGGGSDPSFAEWMRLSISWLDRLFKNPEEAAAEVQKAAYSSKL